MWGWLNIWVNMFRILLVITQVRTLVTSPAIYGIDLCAAVKRLNNPAFENGLEFAEVYLPPSDLKKYKNQLLIVFLRKILSIIDSIFRNFSHSLCSHCKLWTIGSCSTLICCPWIIWIWFFHCPPLPSVCTSDDLSPPVSLSPPLHPKIFYFAWIFSYLY